jgi:hypothetical protein
MNEKEIAYYRGRATFYRLTAEETKDAHLAELYKELAVAFDKEAAKTAEKQNSDTISN